MSVRLSQPRGDCLMVERGRAWSRVAFAAGAIVLMAAALALVDLSTGPGLVLLVLVAGLGAALSVVMLRAARVARWTLVRTQGRLLVDGEPLELARVELRVAQMPITRVPTGYKLSLWLMTSAGPIDVPLGTYRTLIEASSVSGTVEDFVQRANVKQPGHTGA
ncbi:MAG: hypothetical protein IAE78_06545 [Myxococcus sp.]|nr:hypothetical protein [Myxococcus sp.]